MSTFGEWSYDIAAAIGAVVGQVGLPLAVLIWLALLAGVLSMHRRLKGEDTTPHRMVAGVVGGIALAAHLIDFITTLLVTPYLVLETSPLWGMVIDRLGHEAALLYGLTGKAMMVALSYQLYLWYRLQRTRLFPPPGDLSLLPFIQVFGTTTRANLVNFFSFAFPLLSPLMFYVVLLNTTQAPQLLSRLPSLPAVVLAWLVFLPVAYCQVSHQAWRQQ